MPQTIVAGHVCLDVIPAIDGGTGLLKPGVLVVVGKPTIATGGAVANTGVALHRLGVDVGLVARVGDDPFGKIIRDVLAAEDPALAAGINVAAGETSSYTIVYNPVGADRSFLHCPGANDAFTKDDVDWSLIAGARQFHFGYPPLMRGMYESEGRELERVLRAAKDAGVTVSLDMAGVDPASNAGKVDWRALLQRCLPHVDLFVPSLDEILFMLGRDDAGEASPELLRSVTSELIGMGCAVVLLKLGEQGLYVSGTGDEARLARTGRGFPSSDRAWRGAEAYTPCFSVDAVGTTGAGDTTIAGFLAALLRGLPPSETLDAATGVGACCVEEMDAVSGIPHWDDVQARIARGWSKRTPSLCDFGDYPNERKDHGRLHAAQGHVRDRDRRNGGSHSRRSDP